jgi:glycosyltransferase involved in cell wall biosynthesis
LKVVTSDRKKILSQLPAPPVGKKGWPWDIETDPAVYEQETILPKISIVTPSYNQGKYIEKTIRSVLLQNYTNLEYIIIDGGSSDETVDIIKKYSNWITFWESKKDNGQTDAINKGLEKCTGSIFNWLNSDDYYYSDSFKIITENFEPGKTQMLAGNYRMFHEDESEEDKIIDFRLQPTLEETLAIVLINQPSCFFALDSIKTLGNLNDKLQYVMDQDIWKRFLFRFGQDNIKYVDNLLTHFRIHSASKTYQFEFEREYNMIFASIARKCGLTEQAELLETLHEIKDYGGYEFVFDFDETTIETAKRAINNWIYQIARGSYTSGDFQLLGKCLSVLSPKHLNRKQRNYVQRLRIKKTLNKMNMLPLMNFFMKFGKSISFS